MFSLRDALRHFAGGKNKEKPLFRSEKEAYDFCRRLYNESGGVSPELRKSFEFYQKNINNDCDQFFGPNENPHLISDWKR